MQTLQEMAMSGKIRAPDTGYHMYGSKLYLDACVNEIFDMCITRDGEGWIAVCRRGIEKDLYALQFSYFVPHKLLSTLSINDYLRVKDMQNSENIIQASVAEWKEEYIKGCELIKKDTQSFAIKYVIPESFSISEVQTRLICRKTISEFKDGYRDVRLFFNVNLPDKIWDNEGKPVYNFVAYYDYPYAPKPFRIMTDDDKTHSDIMYVVSTTYPSGCNWEANGIQTVLSPIFQEALRSLYDLKVFKSLEEYRGVSPVKLIVREHCLLVYLAEYRDSLYVWSILPSRLYKFPIEAENNNSRAVLLRAILNKAGSEGSIIKWLCSDEDKEKIIADAVILKLGDDDV